MSHRDTEQTGDNKVESPTPTNNTPPVPVPSSAASIHNQIQLLQALIELNQLQQQHQHTTPQQQPPLLSPQLLQLLQCPLPSAPLPLQNVLLPPPGLQPPLEDKNTPRQDSPQQFSPLQSLLQQTQFPTFPPIESLSPLRNPKQTRQDKPRTLCTQSTASQLSPPISTSTSLSTPASKPSDVEVGAINGIEVALSSYKIFRHKKFQMLIKIPPQIKQKLQLSCDDILIAGLNAKCCREGTDEGMRYWLLTKH
ncbi:hypothetical protein Pelo_10771 [Pelomyxa schiedti]|nr:hypothetical protein Pelo_10771 [Pelomyxa schiedti]